MYLLHSKFHEPESARYREQTTTIGRGILDRRKIREETIAVSPFAFAFDTSGTFLVIVRHAP